MPYFDVNIFGTAHEQLESNLFTFNLHVLQVESDITPINFDMFIELYAFPFNFSDTQLTFQTNQLGSTVKAFYFSGNFNDPTPSLTNRRQVRKPHIIHIDNLTPTSPVDLYLCNPGQVNTLNCNSTTLNLLNNLPTPCPNPSDMRLYSSTLCVVVNNFEFDKNFTDIKNPDGSITLNNTTTHFLLPTLITIIADGCFYQQKGEIVIYNNYLQTYTAGMTVNPFGVVDCSTNPRFNPLGFKDKIRVD